MGRHPAYRSSHPGASDIWCSVHDLICFALFHLKQPMPDQHPILSAQTIDEMKVPTARQSPTERYGIGWRIYDRIEDGFIVGHSGGMDGVNTLLKLVPSAQIAIAILTNTNGNRDVAEQLVNDVLSTLLPIYPEKLANKRDQQHDQARPPTGIVDNALVGRWHGYVHTYERDLAFQFQVETNGAIHAQLGTQPETVVRPLHFADDFFEGMMMGRIGTQDTNRYPHQIYLDLKRRDTALTGALIAMPLVTHTLGNRLGFRLSHWVDLQREA
jgi:Beta-lactamase